MRQGRVADRAPCSAVQRSASASIPGHSENAVPEVKPPPSPSRMTASVVTSSVVRLASVGLRPSVGLRSSSRRRLSSSIIVDHRLLSPVFAHPSSMVIVVVVGRSWYVVVDQPRSAIVGSPSAVCVVNLRPFSIGRSPSVGSRRSSVGVRCPSSSVGGGSSAVLRRRAGSSAVLRRPGGRRSTLDLGRRRRSPVAAGRRPRSCVERSSSGVGRRS